jgi:hypothetical protein
MMVESSMDFEATAFIPVFSCFLREVCSILPVKPSTLQEDVLKDQVKS